MSAVKDAVGGIVPSILGGLGVGQQAPAATAPIVAAPTVMPTADDAAVKAAKKRALVQSQQRGGRAATILTAEDDKLG